MGGVMGLAWIFLLGFAGFVITYWITFRIGSVAGLLPALGPFAAAFWAGIRYAESYEPDPAVTSGDMATFLIVSVFAFPWTPPAVIAWFAGRRTRREAEIGG